ncbi:hypothetical protein [Actinoplanes sp. NPDC048796]
MAGRRGGAQKGEFFGTPATVDVVRDGRIIEHWAEVGISQFPQKLAA